MAKILSLFIEINSTEFRYLNTIIVDVLNPECKARVSF